MFAFRIILYVEPSGTENVRDLMKVKGFRESRRALTFLPELMDVERTLKFTFTLKKFLNKSKEFLKANTIYF